MGEYAHRRHNSWEGTLYGGMSKSNLPDIEGSRQVCDLWKLYICGFGVAAAAAHFVVVYRILSVGHKGYPKKGHKKTPQSTRNSISTVIPACLDMAGLITNA